MLEVGEVLRQRFYTRRTEEYQHIVVEGLDLLWGEVIADRYQACDFTTKRFILLQNGTNRISLSHDGLNSVDMMVEAKISYETV